MERIGIAAIVASLIFVGMELQQSRDIAMSEIRAANRANEISMNDAFREPAEVWVCGNSGETLSAADQQIFNLLVRDENDKYFHRIEYFKQMDVDATVHDQVIAQFAAFLYEFPKAREVWARRQNRL